MLISVIMPFHTEIDLIGKSVTSVISQELPSNEYDLEILIGNDGDFSAAQIFAVLPEESHNLVKITKNEEAKGPGGARNSALKIMSGSLVAFLDADDVWLPGKLMAQIKEISRGYSFIATAYVIDNSKKIIQPPVSHDGNLFVFRSLGILTSSVMIASNLVAEEKFKHIRFAQDIDLWHRISLLSEFSYCSSRLPFVSYSSGGTTKNKLTQAIYLWKVMSSNNLAFNKKLNCMNSYFWRGIKNHILIFERFFSSN